MPDIYNRVMKQAVQRLLRISSKRFAVLFLGVAVLVSVLIVLTIDLCWDGRLSAELEFAGVVTPFLDGLILVAFVIAMLDTIRDEAGRRQQAEMETRRLNAELEAKVAERSRQVLAAQEELLRTEKLVLLGQVADTVGHELRNPLGVMNNAVYFLQTVLADADATTREYLGIIEAEIADADRIVSDLLDAVRTQPPHPAPVNLAEALAQTLRKCDIPASVTVRLDIPHTPPMIRVDPMHLHQVLWNLVTNAVEAMPEGGELTIRASADAVADTVTVAIEDSGSGIAPEHQARLFQPMFTTKARRVGLGLVVVKNLTLANGGSVAVASVPGQGSVFSITLPGQTVGSRKNELS